MDFMAKTMLDEPKNDSIYFYQDEAQQHLIASIKRDQVAGIIFHPRKSGVMKATTPLPGL